MEPVDLRAELDRAATRNEPPLTLDTDRLVAAGYRRLRRHRMVRGTGVALATVGTVALPALVFLGGVGGGPVQAGGGGPTIEPTPGAPHGGCRGETVSGSTEAHAMAQWLQGQLPNRQPYHTDAGWQVAYRNDCVDGAHQDSNDVVFRVRNHAGDIQVTTARNEPAERVDPICQTEQERSASSGAGSPPVPSYTGSPTATVTTSGPAAGRSSVPPQSTNPDGGQQFTRCERRPQPGRGVLTIEEWRWAGGPGSGPGVPAMGRTVRLWRADGTVVSVLADNRDVAETPPATQPPLTVDEMVGLVRSPGLQLYIPHPR